MSEDYWERPLTRRELGIGIAGIAGLVAYIFSWDRWAPVTLSRGIEEILRHPVAGPVLLYAGATTVSHLLSRRPRHLHRFWKWST